MASRRTNPEALKGPSDGTGLPMLHLVLALAVVFVWGTNFVVIQVGLKQLPPLLFASLRFLFAALPAVLFVRRPQVSWARLACYGALAGVGQFGLLFIAMRADISPGLASLVIQSQVLFTVAIAAVILREPVRGFQIAALLLAVAGLALIAARGHHAATPLGLGLVLLAGLSWAISNLIVKGAGPVSMLGFVVWASLFSAPPLFVCSLALEGWPAIVTGLRHATAATWLSVLWQSAGNTLFGFGSWSWLLARHPAGTVAPLALLVPIFGMGASAVLLTEPMQPWKLFAATLILASLAVNLIWPSLSARWRGRAIALR